jgi:hypothetical protein
LNLDTHTSYLPSCIGTAEIEVDETASSATWRALLAKGKKVLIPFRSTLIFPARRIGLLKSLQDDLQPSERGQTDFVVWAAWSYLDSFFPAFSS